MIVSGHGNDLVAVVTPGNMVALLPRPTTAGATALITEDVGMRPAKRKRKGLVAVRGLTSRRFGIIRKLLGDASDSSAAILQGKLNDPILIASVRIRIALVFGVLLLMISKLPLEPSLMVITIAAAIGVIAALPAWKGSARRHSAV